MDPSEQTHPDPAAAEVLVAVADAAYDLLHARAQSIGVLDISIEVNGWFVDCELAFTSVPDIGFSLDARTGTCRYCELLPDGGEQWLDQTRDGLRVLDAGNDEELQALALELLGGVLDARRPLLRR